MTYMYIPSGTTLITGKIQVFQASFDLAAETKICNGSWSI